MLVIWSVCLCQELVGVIFYVSAPPLSFDLVLFIFVVSCFAYFPWHQLRALSQAPGKALQMQMCLQHDIDKTYKIIGDVLADNKRYVKFNCKRDKLILKTDKLPIKSTRTR